MALVLAVTPHGAWGSGRADSGLRPMGYETTEDDQYRGAMGFETGVHPGDGAVAVYWAQDGAGVGGLQVLVRTA